MIEISWYAVSAILVTAAVTLLTRLLPFAVFGTRKLPSAVRYLGRVLPPTIMTILVIYCLRSTDFASAPYGFAELFSCGVVVVLQCLRKNMYVSIIAGTLCYMLLTRIAVFG